MGMIDKQYKSVLEKCIEERKQYHNEIKMLEKLIDLNMQDFWDVVDQRDWYYYECQRLKNEISKL